MSHDKKTNESLSKESLKKLGCPRITVAINSCANDCWKMAKEVDQNIRESDFIKKIKEAELLFRAMRKQKRDEYFWIISNGMRPWKCGDDKYYWAKELGLSRIGWLYFRARILRHYKAK